MYGSPATETSSPRRRNPLKPKFRLDAFRGRRLIVGVLLRSLIVWSVLLYLPTPAARAPAAVSTQGPVKITLDDAIQLALNHNHNLLAAQTTIPQDEALETQANLRPNPSLFADWEYLPLNSSGQNVNYLANSTEGDIGLSYLFERGKKRQHRLQA